MGRQQTQHQVFAKICPHRRDPDIKGFPEQIKRHPAILRFTLLCDIHAGVDFDVGRQAAVQAYRKNIDWFQDSVYAIHHPGREIAWGNVNVGDPVTDRRAEEVVHQLLDIDIKIRVAAQPVGY